MLQLVVLTEVLFGVIVVDVMLADPPVGAFGNVHCVTGQQSETFPDPHFVAVV
ncbi:MAG: hypothetical protein ACRDTX_20020 [Pseudonocardiaceae bacterium]